MASLMKKYIGSTRESSGEISSHKWITTETTPDGRILVAHKVDQVYKTLGASPCNLISIFGRARQGKSFLMNCLAGEEQIFKISNEKESCTQGIDISEKWMTVKDFSKVYGGVSCEGKTKVGFVDAEGQGDRDVSYDANLVCPILLASKCVIFNWKGDLQKDHIMSTLGIMTRAAKNVTLSEGELASGKKTFGHLHIIFRDWQAVDSDSDAVYKHLFGLERSEEGAVRDQIRKDVLSNFESVRVWLFDPPSDSTAVLKTKLSISKCSNLFKTQLLSLRKVLSTQLVSPTLFGGQVMTAKTLTCLVGLVVNSLNKGETVLPQSTYSSMVKTEIHQIQAKLDKDMESLCQKELKSIVIESENFKNENIAVKNFEILLDCLIKDYLEEAGETVGTLDGDMWKSTMGDSPAIVANLKNRVCGLFTSKYRELFASWLRSSTTQAQHKYIEKIDTLKNQKWAIPSALLEKKLDSFRDDCFLFLKFDIHENGEEIKSAIEKFDNFIELQNIKFIDLNNKKMQDGELEVKEMVRKAIIQMKFEVDQEVLSLIKCKGGNGRGYSRDGLETRLNEEYFLLDAQMKNSLQGSPFVQSVEKEFKEACVVLHIALNAEYVIATELAFSKTVEKACSQIQNEYLIRKENLSSRTYNEWKIKTSEIYNIAIESVSEWTLDPSDREVLLQPIRTLENNLTQELLGRIKEMDEKKAKEENDRKRKEENERKIREENDRRIKEENEIKAREEKARIAKEENERRMRLEHERRRREEEEIERKRQEDLSAASYLLEQQAIAARLQEEEEENNRMQLQANEDEKEYEDDDDEEEEKKDEDEDVEREAPPKGGLGVRKAAIAQKERAAKWAKDNLGEKGSDGKLKLAAGAGTGKAMSALEKAKEDAKKIQKDKLDARVSKLKPKK